MLLLRKKYEPPVASDAMEPPKSEATLPSSEPVPRGAATHVSSDPYAEASSVLRAVVLPQRVPAAQEMAIVQPTNWPDRNLQIARGVRFRGEIEGCDRLLIDGAFEGEINACRHIVVSDTGRFEGIAVTVVADVAGLCGGSLRVEKLSIARTARVFGSVFYKRIVVEEGAELEGDFHCVSGESRLEAPPAVAPPDRPPSLENVAPEPDVDAPAAVAAAKSAAAERAEVEGMFGTATAACAQSRFDEAELLFKAVIAKSPEHAAALANLGRLARQRGDRAEALAYFEAAASADPRNTQARCDTAAMLHELGRSAEAEAIYKSIVEADPKHAGALSGVAHLARERGEKAVALAHFEAAVAADPSNPWIRCDAAQIMCETGRDSDAEAMFKSVIENYPEHGDALTGLGHLARQRHDWAGALGYFEAAAKVDPRNPRVCCDLANILREVSRFGEAEAMFKTVIEAHPEHAAAMAGLGHIARRRGELGAAIGYFEAAVKADSRNPDWGCELASVLREASRLDEAEQALKTVVETHAQHAAALTALGHLARQREDRAGTLRWFEAAMAADPHDISIRIECARALRQKGEFTRARQILDKVLDEEPGAARA